MKKLFAMLLIWTMLLPAAMAETTLYVDAVNDLLHLRAEPSKESASMGLYYTGTPVTRLNVMNGWYRVRIGDQIGWMMADYVSTVPTEMVGPTKIVRNHSSDWVHLRQGATTQSASLGQVYNFDTVYILGETADGWSYVDWRGQWGFMRTNYLSEKPKYDQTATEIVGRAGEDYLHRFTAENGQELYFVAMEEQPGIVYEDVNFDGHADIVITTVRGATNFFVEFFVWDGNRYVQAQYSGVDSLPNYSLYPEYGLVKTAGVNGWAGALFDHCLFRWEGTDLKLVRRAVSEEKVEVDMVGENMVSTYFNALHVRVMDYPEGSYGSVLMHEEYIQMSEAERENWNFFDRINAVLWQDIR